MKNKRSINGGLSLIEILVAMAILLPATLAILQFYLSNMAFSNINRERTIALTHLTNMAEKIKCTPFGDITTDFPNGVPDAGDSYATNVGGYDLKEEHITVSYEDPESDPLEIDVIIGWQDTRGVSRSSNLSTKRTR